MKYNNMTIKELKEQCREQGLKVSGKKSILIKRLDEPNPQDIATFKEKGKAIIGLGWGDEKSSIIGNLIQKGFARHLYYACDVFYYEIESEKWAEIIKIEKK